MSKFVFLFSFACFMPNKFADHKFASEFEFAASSSQEKLDIHLGGGPQTDDKIRLIAFAEIRSEFVFRFAIRSELIRRIRSECGALRTCMRHTGMQRNTEKHWHTTNTETYINNMVKQEQTVGRTR